MAGSWLNRFRARTQFPMQQNTFGNPIQADQSQLQFPPSTLPTSSSPNLLLADKLRLWANRKNNLSQKPLISRPMRSGWPGGI